jgi:hypothetical protein
MLTVTEAHPARAAARAGDLVRAWAELIAATGAAEPVLGPRGHGLRPAGPDGEPDGESATAGWHVMRAAGPDNRPEGWAAGMAWLRIGMSEWLLAQAVAFLQGRLTGGAPLIQQQLVRGGLADVVIAQQEVLGVLTAPGGLAERLAPYVHARLTQADRITLRLFGAGGFLADGPGRVGHLSELLADAYLDRDPDRDGGREPEVR